MGVMMAFFSTNINCPYFFREFHELSSLGLCVPGVTEGPKVLLKGPWTPQGPLRALYGVLLSLAVAVDVGDM